SARGPPSFFPPSSSAVSPQRSSDSVNTSLARANVPSSRAICSTTSTSSRLIASASPAGTDENAAVRFTSAIGPPVGASPVCDRLGVVLADLHAADAPGRVELEDDQLAVAGVAVGRLHAERVLGDGPQSGNGECGIGNRRIDQRQAA